MIRWLALIILCLGFSTGVMAAERTPVTKYLPSNIVNVSNALFKIGMLRPSDTLAVDEYLRIHHCGLYEQYGSNDISWSRLREAQARDLALLQPLYKIEQFEGYNFFPRTPHIETLAILQRS